MSGADGIMPLCQSHYFCPGAPCAIQSSRRQREKFSQPGPTSAFILFVTKAKFWPSLFQVVISTNPNGCTRVESFVSEAIYDKGHLMKIASHLIVTATVFTCVSSVSAGAESGIASTYSTESGSRTASGQKLNPGALTAAHRSLPFGSKVKITNTRNGHSVIVTINDRGPFVRGRVIDLTPAAANALSFSGLASVRIERAD